MSIVLSTDIGAALRERDAMQLPAVDDVVCVECGCSHTNPCVDEFGQPCGWMWVNEQDRLGLCTACAS